MVWEAISKTQECLIRYRNTSKLVEKKLGCALFFNFSTHFALFGYPDETLFLVFDTLHHDQWNYQDCTWHANIYFFLCSIILWPLWLHSRHLYVGLGAWQWGFHAPYKMTDACFTPAMTITMWKWKQVETRGKDKLLVILGIHPVTQRYKP